MEILRLASTQPEAIIEVGQPNTEYEYQGLDLSDGSHFDGIATSDSSSKVAIPLSSEYDSEYKIKIDYEDHFVTVVRPYIDSNTLASKASEIAKFEKHEELVRAIIDSVIPEGFYYRKKVIETSGLGADYLPIWQNAQKLLKLSENNVKIFDSAHPEQYNLKYSLTQDKTAITIDFSEQINKAEAANLVFPMVASDLWDMKFGYRGFPKGFDYVISLETGYKKVPADIKRATLLLIEDLECGKLEYIERYVKEYQTDQYKIKFDGRVFEGTGNLIADKILSKYAKSIRHVGVL
jgi:hypothetical protein